MPDEATTPDASGNPEAAAPTEATATPEASTATSSDTEARASMLAAFNRMSEPEKPKDADPAEDTAAGDPDPDAADAEDQQDQPPTEDADPGIDPDELAKARDALKRGQWTDDDLARLDPARILEKGKAALKREKDQAAHHNELLRVRQALEQIERERAGAGQAQATSAPAEPDAQTRSRGGASPLSGTVKQTIGDILAPLRDGENADLYGDLVDPLAIGFTTVAEQIQAEHQAQLEAFQQQAQAALTAQEQRYNELMGQMDRVNLRMAADDPDIRKEFPELRKPDVFSKVVNKAISLSNLRDGGYHDDRGEPIYSELVRDAAALVIERQDPVKQAQARIARQQRTVADGQPAPDTGAADRPRSLSPRDAMIRAAQRLHRGAQVEEVRRELTSVG